MPERQILAMGGFPDDALLDHALALARGKRILYVPTAVREDPDQIVFWYDRLRARGTTTHLAFFPWPPAKLRSSLGNTTSCSSTAATRPMRSRSGGCTASTRSCAKRGRRESC